MSTAIAAASGTDLHRMWDDRCAECHGHSGDFARKYLTVSGSELLGVHHRDDLKLFMGNHYVAESEVDAVYDMLYAQVNSEPRFRSECTGCHETAVEFVRRSLELRGDILFNLTSGIPIDLRGGRHAGLDQDDALFYVDLLTRIAREVGQQ